MNELLQEIDRAYQSLQEIQIQPTKHNVMILMMTMQALERAHGYILEHGEEEKPDAGDA